MPIAFTGIPAQPALPRKRWTRREWDELSSSGILNGQRLELIAGELIDKMGKNPPHVTSVSLLLKWLFGVFGADFVLQGAPIDVAPEDTPTNEPEPDLIVLTKKQSLFSKVNPRPQDLVLVIEVANSTLRFDLEAKAKLYARADISDYWVLDVSGRRLIVHRNPQGGQYTSVASYGEDESVAPKGAPWAKFLVKDAFPE